MVQAQAQALQLHHIVSNMHNSHNQAFWPAPGGCPGNTVHSTTQSDLADKQAHTPAKRVSDALDQLKQQLVMPAADLAAGAGFWGWP